MKSISGKGIYAIVLGNKIKIGSSIYLENKNSFNEKNKKSLDTKVYISINEKTYGYFEFTNLYREGIDELIRNISENNDVYLLSGDNEGEKKNLLNCFKDLTKLKFNQTPNDKLNFINSLQKENKKVLMIGDGLNDAGALSKSDVGISVTENISNFSPACDAILEASMLNKLNSFIKFSKISINIILVSFGISFLYNLIGLGFAVQGLLSPIVAAILMPVSSISVVLFATVSTNYFAKRRGLLSRY